MQAIINNKVVWVNCHHLYYFFIVVNEGGLARASKVLSIGQPTLSSQIKQLEISLGVELFDRTNKRLELTAAGRLAHHYATNIFRIGTEMIQSLSEDSSLQKNSIRLGLTSNIPKALMLSLFRKLSGDSKSVNISEGKTSDLLSDLEGKKLDFVITNNPPMNVNKSGFECRKISSSQIVICGHKKFIGLAEKFPLSLANASFMLPLANTRLRMGLDGFFRQHNLKIDVIGETKDFDMQKLIALEGLGLIAAPLHMVNDYIQDGQLTVIGNVPSLQEELYILFNSHHLGNITCREMVDNLQSGTL
ncbi:MAG: LysR family transcriptional regulator [Bdellovibrionota bacterium]